MKTTNKYRPKSCQVCGGWILKANPNTICKACLAALDQLMGEC